MYTRVDCPWCKAFTGARFALRLSLILLAVLLLSACAPAAPAATATPTALPPSPTSLPTATTLPSPTPLPPSPTPTFTSTPSPQPSPTATATPLPAILSDGFDAWCIPGDSHNLGVMTATMPSDAGRYKALKDGIQLTVPMGACIFVYKFNQAMPANAEFRIFDILDHLAYTLPLTSPDGQPNVGVVSLTNKLMLDPPYYAISFRIAIFTPDNGQLWTSKVTFARPIPVACFDPASGIWPDPVTGACPAADPREPELCRKANSISCYFKNFKDEKKGH
jgi:hypothetical protein